VVVCLLLPGSAGFAEQPTAPKRPKRVISSPAWAFFCRIDFLQAPRGEVGVDYFGLRRGRREESYECILCGKDRLC
jgi:hypothetical protein